MRNIAKKFKMTMSLIDIDTVKPRYKCFFGEDVELCISVVDEDKKPVDLTDVNAKVYYTCDKFEPLRQDNDITINEPATNGTINILVNKKYLRLGVNTIRVALFDSDQEVLLQPCQVNCIETGIGDEHGDVIVNDDINVKDEFIKTNNKVKGVDNRLKVVERNVPEMKSELVDVNRQLDTKANKNEIWTMANMGQDIKETMTGGSVAVVGVKGVGVINLDRNIEKDICEYIENKATLSGKYFVEEHGMIIEKVSNSYYYIIDECEYGDSYLYTGNSYNFENHYSIFFTDSDGKVVSKHLNDTSSNVNYKDYYCYAPKGATKIYVTSYASKAIIKKSHYVGIANKSEIKDVREKCENLPLENVNVKQDDISVKTFKTYGSDSSLNQNTLPLTITKSSNGYGGAYTLPFTPNGSMLMKICIKGSHNLSGDGTFDLFLFGQNVGSLSTKKTIDTSSQVFNIVWELDPAWFDQYKNETQFYIILASDMVGSFEIIDYKVLQSELYNYDIYDDNLGGIIKNIGKTNDSLKAELSTINAKVDALSNKLISPNGTEYTLSVTDNGDLIALKTIPDKSLFIGNSLVFGNDMKFGLCALSSKDDYYYKLTKHLKSKNSSFTASKLYASWWESYSTMEEKEQFVNEKLIPALSPDLDFVSIQLGDNVNTEGARVIFKESAINLVRTIRSNCPKARISWIAEWYSGASIEDIIEVCNVTGIKYVPIKDLRSTETEGKIGDTVIFDDGSSKEITTSGQASHPNNLGHLKIANRVAYYNGFAQSESEII